MAMVRKLTEKEQELLQEACEISGASYRDDYSGRAMWGEECVGIVINSNNQLQEIADFLGENRKRKLANEITTRWRRDSMGMGTIIYAHF